MTSYTLTGANGFLGWHTRCAIAEKKAEFKSFKLGKKYLENDAAKALNETDTLIHIAGVNRGSEEEVFNGNILFAEQVRKSLFSITTPPSTIVFANSIQANNGSNYGESKKRAAEILQRTAEELGINFRNILIPNVFGEHGQPFYNAVTSTFCHQLSTGEKPEIQRNSDLSLVHAQDVADFLIGSITNKQFSELEVRIDVKNLLRQLSEISITYKYGDIPDLSNRFSKNLFNTYRSYLLPNNVQFSLEKKNDNRGAFFEIVRVWGGQGQSSFSTTYPGITRGEHFHRRKIERFTVLSGKAKISMRKMFSNDVLSFEVEGNNPVSIDMPTMWTHNITNIGNEILYTSFWINEIFDPEVPDTIYEKVAV